MSIFHSVNPSTGEALQAFTETTPQSIARSVEEAARAARSSAWQDATTRAALLRDIAARLRADADALHPTTASETGLPQGRLEGELERTCVQLELFASLIDEGDYVEAVIDRADPDAPIAPRPDLRRMLVPIGPVGVFAASNFPYAFSVAGGDTAAALASGCPVVVKAHPSHPGTSALVAERVSAAVDAAGLPAALFTLVQGASTQVGAALVEAPEVAAIGFTGSYAGGRALFDLAARRPTPVPVFAEMGSINPVVVSGDAARTRGGEIAEALAQSIAMGTGQFCTKPGVIFVPAGADGDGFCDALATTVSALPAGTMLNQRIFEAFERDVATLADHDRVAILARGADAASAGYAATPTIAAVDLDAFLADDLLARELFGPFGLVVRYAGPSELERGLGALGGQLTATLHAEPEELEGLAGVVARLAGLAGRLLFGGMPTGVAVTRAMHHGGPFPASTTPDTSVGTAAISRFMRPIALQNAPAAALPPELADANPRGIWRRVDGELTREAL